METALERELGGAPTGGGELAAPASVVAIEGMLAPQELMMMAPSATRIKEGFPEHAWANLEQPGQALLGRSVKYATHAGALSKGAMETPNIIDRSFDLVLVQSTVLQ